MDSVPGGQVVLDGIGQLIGRAASIETEREIIDAIIAVPGVVGIDKVVMEHVGPRLRVDVHVYADARCRWKVPTN